MQVDSGKRKQNGSQNEPFFYLQAAIPVQLLSF